MSPMDSTGSSPRYIVGAGEELEDGDSTSPMLDPDAREKDRHSWDSNSAVTVAGVRSLIGP